MRSGPIVSIGAGGRTRTGTAVRPTDFKSVVSAIPPHPQQLILYRIRGNLSRKPGYNIMPVKTNGR